MSHPRSCIASGWWPWQLHSLQQATTSSVVELAKSEPLAACPRVSARRWSTVLPLGSQCGLPVQAVLVHQLSKGLSQTPFRKNKGRLVEVAFHPSKPFFFVASQHQARAASPRGKGACAAVGGTAAYHLSLWHSSMRAGPACAWQLPECTAARRWGWPSGLMCPA